MTGIVRDLDPYAYSTKSRGAWAPDRRRAGGYPTAWRWGSLHIKEARNSAGLLCFKVLFPNGKHAYQASLSEAMDYAEAQCARNS